MQVKKLNQSILNVPDWAQFLSRSSVIIATVLLGSALIMAIAANWLSWPKLLRVVLIQATITALVLFAWKRGQQKSKEWASVYSLSSLSVNLAAIAIGGLLALIGQSYQTGADPWWLFAIWALLLLPWLITLRSLFIILLVLVLTNVALFLFAINSITVASGQPMSLLFIAINLLAIYLGRNSNAQIVLRPVAMLLLVGTVLLWQAATWIEDLNGATLQGVLCLAIFIGLAVYYARYRVDFLTAVLSYAGVYVLSLALIAFSGRFSTDTVLLLFFVGAALGFVLIRDLRRLWGRSSMLKEPWFLRLVYLLVQGLVALFFMLAYLLVIGELHEVVIHLYVVSSVVAIVLLQRGKRRAFSQDLPLFLLLSSMVLGAVGLSAFGANKDVLFTWFILLSLVVYAFSPKDWLLRFCSAFIATALAAVWWFSYILIPGYIQLFLFAAVLVLAAVLYYQPSSSPLLKPLWWAWVVALVLSVAWEPPYHLVPAALPPLGILALLGWVWAYAQRDSVLFWSSALLLTAALGQHYYLLEWSLIQKAMALAVGGLVLGVCALLLQGLISKPDSGTKTAPASTKHLKVVVPPRITAGLWLGLGAVLLMSGQDVARKEYLLANGVPVILTLAPVDPRSLMQGDYMALNFTLSRQVEQMMAEDMNLRAAKTSSVLVYMKSSAQGPSALVALQNPVNSYVYWINGVEEELNNLAVLRMQRNKGRWLPNGIDAWFFPEGQAAAVEQARFGEFKTNAQGRALLYQLID